MPSCTEMLRDPYRTGVLIRAVGAVGADCWLWLFLSADAKLCFGFRCSRSVPRV